MNHFVKVSNKAIINVANVEAIFTTPTGVVKAWLVSGGVVVLDEKAASYFESIAQVLTEMQESEREDFSLKPCPFCGSDVTQIKQNDNGEYSVICLNCYAQGPLTEIEKAQAEWNNWNERRNNND